MAIAEEEGDLTIFDINFDINILNIYYIQSLKLSPAPLVKLPILDLPFSLR